MRPGARFVFPFHLLPPPSTAPPEPGEERRGELPARAGGKDEESPEALCAAVRSWLVTGLTSWGAGGKTAAGYGYFSVAGGAAGVGETARVERNEAEERRAPARAQPAPKMKAPIVVSWEQRVSAIAAGSAADAVPALLAGLTGADRRSAAQAVVGKLGKKWLARPDRRDREWVRELLAAAEGAESPGKERA